MAVIICKEVSVPSPGKMLGDYAEGDLVQIPENGTPVEFYVAKHDYESGLNGAGRTLLVRKDCYGQIKWHSGAASAWATCYLRSWMNGTYLGILGDRIQEKIGTTKYYYTVGKGDPTLTIRSDAVFILSKEELGDKTSGANSEGSTLPIYQKLKIAYQDGSSTSQWTRTPWIGGGTGLSWLLASQGYATYELCTNTHGSRPCFTLPASTKFNPDTGVIL